MTKLFSNHLIVIVSFALVILPCCKQRIESAHTFSSQSGKTLLNTILDSDAHKSLMNSNPNGADAVQSSARQLLTEKNEVILVHPRTQERQVRSANALLSAEHMDWDRYVRSDKLEGVLLSMKQSKSKTAPKMILTAHREADLSVIEYTIIDLAGVDVSNYDSLNSIVVSKSQSLASFSSSVASKTQGFSLTMNDEVPHSLVVMAIAFILACLIFGAGITSNKPELLLVAFVVAILGIGYHMYAFDR